MASLTVGAAQTHFPSDVVVGHGPAGSHTHLGRTDESSPHTHVNDRTGGNNPTSQSNGHTQQACIATNSTSDYPGGVYPGTDSHLRESVDDIRESASGAKRESKADAIRESAADAAAFQRRTPNVHTGDDGVASSDDSIMVSRAVASPAHKHKATAKTSAKGKAKPKTPTASSSPKKAPPRMDIKPHKKAAAKPKGKAPKVEDALDPSNGADIHLTVTPATQSRALGAIDAESFGADTIGDDDGVMVPRVVSSPIHTGKATAKPTAKGRKHLTSITTAKAAHSKVGNFSNMKAHSISKKAGSGTLQRNEVGKSFVGNTNKRNSAGVSVNSGFVIKKKLSPEAVSDRTMASHSLKSGTSRSTTTPTLQEKTITTLDASSSMSSLKTRYDARTMEAQERAKNADQLAQEAETRARDAEKRAGFAEARANEAASRLKDAEKRAGDAEVRVNDAKTRADNLGARVNDLQTRAEKAEELLRETDDKLDSVEAVWANTAQHFENLLNKLPAQYEEEAEEIKKQIVNSERKLKNLSRDFHDLSSELQKKEKEPRALVKTSPRTGELEKQMSRSDKALEQMTRQIKSVAKKISVSGGKVTSLHEENKRLQERNERLAEEKHSLELDSAHVDDGISETEPDLKDKNSKLQEENQEEIDDDHELHALANQYETQLKDTKKQLTELRAGEWSNSSSEQTLIKIIQRMKEDVEMEINDTSVKKQEAEDYLEPSSIQNLESMADCLERRSKEKVKRLFDDHSSALFTALRDPVKYQIDTRAMYQEFLLRRENQSTDEMMRQLEETMDREQDILQAKDDLLINKENEPSEPMLIHKKKNEVLATQNASLQTDLAKLRHDYLAEKARSRALRQENDDLKTTQEDLRIRSARQIADDTDEQLAHENHALQKTVGYLHEEIRRLKAKDMITLEGEFDELRRRFYILEHLYETFIHEVMGLELTLELSFSHSGGWNRIHDLDSDDENLVLDSILRRVLKNSNTAKNESRSESKNTLTNPRSVQNEETSRNPPMFASNRDVADGTSCNKSTDSDAIRYDDTFGCFEGLKNLNEDGLFDRNEGWWNENDPVLIQNSPSLGPRDLRIRPFDDSILTENLEMKKVKADLRVYIGTLVERVLDRHCRLLDELDPHGEILGESKTKVQTSISKFRREMLIQVRRSRDVAEEMFNAVVGTSGQEIIPYDGFEQPLVGKNKLQAEYEAKRQQRGNLINQMNDEELVRLQQQMNFLENIIERNVNAKGDIDSPETIQGLSIIRDTATAHSTRRKKVMTNIMEDIQGEVQILHKSIMQKSMEQSLTTSARSGNVDPCEQNRFIDMDLTNDLNTKKSDSKKSDSKFSFIDLKGVADVTTLSDLSTVQHEKHEQERWRIENFVLRCSPVFEKEILKGLEVLLAVLPLGNDANSNFEESNDANLANTDEGKRPEVRYWKYAGFHPSYYSTPPPTIWVPEDSLLTTETGTYGNSVMTISKPVKGGTKKAMKRFHDFRRPVPWDKSHCQGDPHVSKRNITMVSSDIISAYTREFDFRLHDMKSSLCKSLKDVSQGYVRIAISASKETGGSSPQSTKGIPHFSKGTGIHVRGQDYVDDLMNDNDHRSDLKKNLRDAVSREGTSEDAVSALAMNMSSHYVTTVDELINLKFKTIKEWSRDLVRKVHMGTETDCAGLQTTKAVSEGPYQVSSDNENSNQHITSTPSKKYEPTIADTIVDDAFRDVYARTGRRMGRTRSSASENKMNLGSAIEGEGVKEGLRLPQSTMHKVMSDIIKNIARYYNAVVQESIEYHDWSNQQKINNMVKESNLKLEKLARNCAEALLDDNRI